MARSPIILAFIPQKKENMDSGNPLWDEFEPDSDHS